MKKIISAPQTYYFCSLAATALLFAGGITRCLADPSPAPASVTLTAATATAVPGQGNITAASVTYDKDTIIAEGTLEEPVTYRSGAVTITAQKVLIDTTAQTLSAIGTVTVTQQLTTTKRPIARPNRLIKDYYDQYPTETLRGDHFLFDYGKHQGTMDNVRVLLVDFNISASQLIINGQRYTAKDVVIRPGGLTDEELKIYGTPPLSLRAKSMMIDNSRTASITPADKAQNASASNQPVLSAEGAALYFNNTKILPVPNYVLRQIPIDNNRQKQAFNIVPNVSVDSADGLLLTTQLQYAFHPQNPNSLLLVTDLGISLRQGFRGGVGLNSQTKYGLFNVNAHVNDIVTDQIDNRILLNRLPEFKYSSPQLGLFKLPGNRQAGVLLGFSWGDYRETDLDSNREVDSARTQLYAKFTTRLKNPRGPYIEITGSRAKYSNFDQDYSTLGYEVGYYDRITKYIDGQFSYSRTSVSGATPFIFDSVEIPSEIRTTFDILLTPRYIVPIDLRYDTELREFRDKSFGILRNYKTFAYGLTYDTANRALSLEFRQGF